MNLEWDDGKNEINKQKHHVSFETASYVFADPFRLERLADVRERRIYYGDSKEADSDWRKAD